jgi:hypothetical protein
MGNVGSTDMQPPIINCPNNITVAFGSPPVVNNIAPSVSDNCGNAGVGFAITGATNISQPNNSNASGTSFGPGTSIVTYTATDSAGLQSSCSFQVQVVQQFNNLTFELQGADLNCGSTIGLNVNTYLFNNISGFQHSITWNPNVLVFDSVGSIHPGIGASVGNLVVNTVNSGSGFITLSWVVTNPALFSSGQTLTSGSSLLKLYFKAGGSSSNTTSLQFSNMPTQQLVINPNGNAIPANYVSSIVNVLDNASPSISCPNNQIITVPNGSTSANVNGLLASALDNCGLSTLTYSRIVGGGLQMFNGSNASGSYTIGTSVVTFTATDFSGNTATCSTIIQVNGPAIIEYVLGNATIDCSSNEEILIPVFTKHIQDVAGIQSTIQWDPALLMYQGFSAAQALNSGNIVFAPFLNNVNAGIFQYSIGSSGPAFLPDVLPGDTLLVLRLKKVFNFSSTQVNVTDFPTLTEFSSNTFLALPFSPPTPSIVTITDLLPPVFTNCPSNISIPASGVQANACGAVATWPIVLAADNCTSNVTPALSQGSLPSGSFFPVGISQVSYTSTDDRNLTTTCSFSVTVTDNSPVTFNYCPPNVILNLAFGRCDTLFSWVAPTATNVSAICGVQSVSSPITPPSIFELGTTTVQYTATSTSGNTGTCAFTVTVQQNNPPQFNNCPVNITLNIANGCDTIYNFAQPLLTGVCNLTTLSIIKPVGNLFPIGNTNVTYTATGSNGIATCSFIVAVRENKLPTVICPPSDTIFIPSGATSSIVTGLVASASDNCGTASLSFMVNGGSSTSGANASGSFPLGVTPVAFTATDASGNTSSCSFSITVFNIPDTVLLSIEDVNIDCKDTTVVVLVNLEDFDAVQNMQFSINFDETFLEYQSTIISTDLGAGFTMNVASAGSGVLIFTGGNSAGLVDTLPNNLLLQLTFKVLQQSGNTTVSLPNLTSPGAGQVYFQYSGNASDVLPYTLTNGVITIQDLLPPAILCPADTVFISNLIQNQSCGVLAGWSEVSVSDNCSDVVSLVTSHPPQSFFALGTTMVTYTATDEAGLSSTCSFNVIVQDTVAPI